MLKCKVCGTEFPAIEERHYIARDNSLGNVPKEAIYDAYDCPMCGCQVVAQERKRILEPEENMKEE